MDGGGGWGVLKVSIEMMLLRAAGTKSIYMTDRGVTP